MSKDLLNLILIRLDGCLTCIVDCTSVTEVHKQLHMFIAKYLLFPPIVLHVFGGLITLMELRLHVCHHKSSHNHHEHDSGTFPNYKAREISRTPAPRFLARAKKRLSCITFAHIAPKVP
eukprot:UN27446